MPQRGAQRVPRAMRRPAGLLAALALAGVAAPGCERLAPRARPAPPALPRIAWGPWVLSPGPARATVAWTTAEKTAGAVAFGTSASLDGVARETEPRTDHRVVLTGLSPLTRYRYRVEAAVPAEGSFSTAPDPRAEVDARFRVLVIGDNRGSAGDHELVVRAASAEDAQLTLHTGDMVVNAADPELWARWFETERDLLSHTAFVPTVGNHEITDRGVAYAAHFLDPGKPAYKALDYGPLHILVLDSFEQAAGADPHEAAISDAQRAWAEEDVKALEPGRHLWVLVHQGPYSHPQNPRPGHGGSEAVQRVVAALQKLHPVEAVFAGHEHFYERGLIDRLNFFVVGGGGAPLEEPDAAFPSVQSARKALSYAVLEVCGCHVSGTAKDIFGTAIDAFTLSDCPRPCGARVSAAAPAGSGAPAGAPGPAGKPNAAPERGRGLAPDPARTVAPDPVRAVDPDPIRVVEPDPPGSGAPGADAEGAPSAPAPRGRQRRRRDSREDPE